MGDWPRATLADFVTGLGDPGLPAAGAASAVTCAAAAALVQLALGKDDPEAARAGELARGALDLVDRDERAYAALMEALGRDDADELEARREASRPPLEVAESAAEVAELAERAAASAPPARRGDAVAAVALARGAGIAALALVDANLEGAPAGEPLVERARELSERLR